MVVIQRVDGALFSDLRRNTSDVHSVRSDKGFVPVWVMPKKGDPVKVTVFVDAEDAGETLPYLTDLVSVVRVEDLGGQQSSDVPVTYRTYRKCNFCGHATDECTCEPGFFG